MEIPQEIKMEPPFDPVILLLNVYGKDLKSAYYMDVAIPKYIAAHFIIAKL